MNVLGENREFILFPGDLGALGINSFTKPALRKTAQESAAQVRVPPRPLTTEMTLGLTVPSVVRGTAHGATRRSPQDNLYGVWHNAWLTVKYTIKTNFNLHY